MNTPTTIETNGTPAGFINPTQAHHKDLMRFDHQGKMVGRLNVVDGKLVFTGDADQSARQLFDLVCKLFNSK